MKIKDYKKLEIKSDLNVRGWRKEFMHSKKKRCFWKKFWT